jgi:AAA domain
MIEPEFPECPPGDPFPATHPANGHRDTHAEARYRVYADEITRRNENQALDIKAVQKDRVASMTGYPFVTFDEMDVESPAKQWLIKGILARGETSAWIAAPGAMKSALLAQAAICVGAGLDWHGYRNKGAAGVVYFAIERADLVKRRLRAHRRKLGLAGTPIAVSSSTIDLTHPDAFKKVIDTIRDAKAILGADIGLVIIDTFAKLIAAAAGDENSAKDQGAVFANVQRVKNATGVHVALIGHTGKDESRGARGSNALLGEVDVMVTISGEEVKTATVTKANDAPEGALFSFKSEVYEFGTDDDGDPITVNVVSSEEVSAQSAPKLRDPKLKPNQQTVFSLLHSSGSAGLTLEDWNSQAKDAGIGTKRKADLTDIRNALLSKGLVRNYGDRWHVVHSSGGS